MYKDQQVSFVTCMVSCERRGITVKIEELRSAIESYPHSLYKALEAVNKAEKTIERLTEDIEIEEAHLFFIEGTGDNSAQSGENVEKTLVRLDHELALLEVSCEQIKGHLELEYRRKPPEGYKVTEATVAAFVKSHPQFVEAQERYLNKKFERDTANVSRRADYTAAATATAEHHSARKSQSVTSPELMELHGQLIDAEMTVADAEMSLEEVKASLLSYQMLVQLYTAGLVK